MPTNQMDEVYSPKIDDLVQRSPFGAPKIASPAMGSPQIDKKDTYASEADNKAADRELRALKDVLDGADMGFGITNQSLLNEIGVSAPSESPPSSDCEQDTENPHVFHRKPSAGKPKSPNDILHLTDNLNVPHSAAPLGAAPIACPSGGSLTNAALSPTNAALSVAPLGLPSFGVSSTQGYALGCNQPSQGYNHPSSPSNATTPATAPTGPVIVSTGNYENPFETPLARERSATADEMVDVGSVHQRVKSQDGQTVQPTVDWRPSYLRDENEINTFQYRQVPKFSDTLKEIGVNLKDHVAASLWAGFTQKCEAPNVQKMEEEELVFDSDKLTAVSTSLPYRFHYLDFSTLMILSKMQLVGDRMQEFGFICNERQLVSCKADPKTHSESTVFEANMPIETGTFSKTEIRIREIWDINWNANKCTITFRNLTPLWALSVRGKILISAEPEEESHRKILEDIQEVPSEARDKGELTSIRVRPEPITAAKFEKRGGVYMSYNCTAKVSEMESTFSVEYVKEVFRKKTNDIAIFFQRFDKGSYDFKAEIEFQRKKKQEMAAKQAEMDAKQAEIAAEEARDLAAKPQQGGMTIPQQQATGMTIPQQQATGAGVSQRGGNNATNTVHAGGNANNNIGGTTTNSLKVGTEQWQIPVTVEQKVPVNSNSVTNSMLMAEAEELIIE